MILSGCAHSVAPSSLAIQLPRDCEALARNVEDPALDVATDPKLAVGEYEVALDEANGNITATRTCQVNQRKRFAKGS
jgi:hypothetical protein